MGLSRIRRFRVRYLSSWGRNWRRTATRRAVTVSTIAWTELKTASAPCLPRWKHDVAHSKIQTLKPAFAIGQKLPFRHDNKGLYENWQVQRGISQAGILLIPRFPGFAKAQPVHDHREPSVSQQRHFKLYGYNTLERFAFTSVIETFDYGFHWYWQSLVRPLPTAARECWWQSERAIRRIKSNSAKPDKLTLTNLTGAFVVLGIGFTASFVAFVSEFLTARLSANKRTKQARLNNQSFTSFINNWHQ